MDEYIMYVDVIKGNINMFRYFVLRLVISYCNREILIQDIIDYKSVVVGCFNDELQDDKVNEFWGLVYFEC